MQYSRNEAFGVDEMGPDAPRGVDDWCAAVALGAQGRVAAARTVLDRLDLAGPVERGLAGAVRGSLVRQAGRHGDARTDDGRACLAVAQLRHDDEWARAVWLDALIGLAADDLGVGAFAASDALLCRVGGELDALAGVHDMNWVTIGRVRLRHAWVRTEHALYTGDSPMSSEWTTRAREFADSCPSPRHRAKTDLIDAAVTAAHGATDRAAEKAEKVENRCRAAGLLPLAWAAATMLAGLDPADRPAATRVAEYESILAARGMTFAPRA